MSVLIDDLLIWLHYEQALHHYSYQLFTNRPILRWDNSPHYPDISTEPNHFHNEFGKVSKSPLSGRPLKDLKKVLYEIESWLSKTTK